MFDAIQQQRDDQTEVFAELQIKLLNKPGTHTLKAKVDTGAEGDILPLQSFCRMFPNKVDSLGQPLSGTTQKELTVLTAYNGSVCIWFAYKGKWTTLKFFVVTTDGPTIIGSPLLRDLDLISIHCAIQKTQDPINSTSELTTHPQISLIV